MLFEIFTNGYVTRFASWMTVSNKSCHLEMAGKNYSGGVASPELLSIYLSYISPPLPGRDIFVFPYLSCVSHKNVSAQ